MVWIEVKRGMMDRVVVKQRREERVRAEEGTLWERRGQEGAGGDLEEPEQQGGERELRGY